MLGDRTSILYPNHTETFRWKLNCSDTGNERWLWTQFPPITFAQAPNRLLNSFIYHSGIPSEGHQTSGRRELWQHVGAFFFLVQNKWWHGGGKKSSRRVGRLIQSWLDLPSNSPSQSGGQAQNSNRKSNWSQNQQINTMSEIHREINNIWLKRECRQTKKTMKGATAKSNNHSDHSCSSVNTFFSEGRKSRQTVGGKME